MPPPAPMTRSKSKLQMRANESEDRDIPPKTLGGPHISTEVPMTHGKSNRSRSRAPENERRHNKYSDDEPMTHGDDNERVQNKNSTK